MTVIEPKRTPGVQLSTADFASREQLRATLAGIGYAVMTTDRNGRITLLNPAAEALTGWKSEESLDQPIQSVFQGINHLTGVTAAEIVSRVLQEGRAARLSESMALVTKDGREVPIRFSAAPILNDGKVTGAMVVFHDVTEKSRAEAKVFEAQRRLEALLEALPVGINFSEDATCQFITGNPAAMAQFEASPGDNISASAPDENTAGRQAKFFREGRQISDSELAIQRAVAENRVIPPYEIEIQAASGRRRFVEISGAPIRDQLGNVIGGVSVTVDISARKKAEAALRQSEERWSTTLRSIGDAVIATDAAGKVLFLNAVAENLTGWRAEEAQGQPCRSILQIVHEQTRTPVEDVVARVLAEGRGVTLDSSCLLRARDGREFPIEDSAAPIVDAAGNVAGVVLVFRDVTEKRRSAEQRLTQIALERVRGQLIEAQEKERSRIARELHDDISQEIALLSIDLDQAMQSVDAAAPLAERRSTERRGAEVARLQRLQQASQRCFEIGRAIHALSHELHPSHLDYLGIVAAARAFCVEFSEKHRFTVEFTSADVPRLIPRDVSLCLFRILQEALRNAAKYSGVSSMEVSLRGSADGIELKVHDAGAGFDRGEAAKHEGLGLVSMKERANLVLGTLSIESKPNGGTTITVRVPLEQNASAAS